MSNFAFIKSEWPELLESAVKAESLAPTDARSCCFYARRALELAIDWLYEHDAELERPYDDNLSALIYEPAFKQNLPGELFLKVKTINEVGNLAVHSQKPITCCCPIRGSFFVEKGGRRQFNIRFPKLLVRTEALFQDRARQQVAQLRAYHRRCVCG